MLKGISTLVEYDECIKKGLCEEHLKDINKNDLAAVRNEFPKKAFKFVRVNVLYPFLCGNPPKCEKMKKLMEKTPPIAKALIDGKAGRAVSEEAANVILIMDSVVIFTICQLSKICCIGAIFHTTKNSDDPNINSIQNLLLVERLNADIRYLYPVLQKNFDGFDLAVIRATYCITLLFIRKFCHKRSMKKAIETVENDIITNCDFKEVTVVCSEYSYKNISCVIQKTSTSSSASFNDFYSSKDYVELSNVFYADKKYEIASFYGYLGVSMEDSVGDAYFPFVKALLIQQKFKEAFDVITYGISHCSKNSKQYKQLTKLLGGLSKHINPVPVESTNNVSENSVNHNDIKDKILTNSKENSKSGLVDLVDSDSGESDSEVTKELPGSGLNELVVDSDDNSEAVEKKEIKSESKEEQKSKSPECIKENAVAQEVDKLTDTAYSDDESENKKKKQIMCGTKEKTKIKAYTRRKRTISEGSVDNQQEEEIDINKINSYLKEASEALLADCGYKAVQIFRGPLRKFIESSDFLSFEECDIVCIKYSYGIAYCKSGGHDDLEKCITILKDIIENHDSITFPAAHYALGLAFRKLNRFKEALINLEIVQNFLNKGIHFKIYPWPGMTTVIQETKPDILKNLVQDLIKECENPPNPDAFCRYETCSFQPTIYYTDPDFKGYVSLSCSEQCNLQYHLQCWKIMKEEKNLTDKEFLEKPCFTPDCEGFIAKIQNIDKKGDLAKEFTSEFKKPQKLPKKWEKKTDNKEKRKKKIAVKYEGGSEEILTENGKDHSRKSSICENDASENKKEHSRESSICDNETVSQFSGSCISNDEISCKSECDQKSLENLKQKADVPASSSSNFISSSLQENSSINHVDNFKEMSIPSEENETELMESIKNNTYSYMADFLQYHGPLRIDDPLLTNEIESFPDEIYNIVSKIGGIGEFLKNDLRFAFVGDLYICIIDDVAKAYQMLSNASLLTDFKNFPPLESTEDSKYYRENGELPDAKHSSFLNPDAQEYTPSSNKNNVYKFTTNNLHQDFDSCCSLPVNLESPSKHPNSVSQLDTFPVTESLVGKSKSCEAVLNNKFQKNAELFASRSKEKSVLLANESVTKSALHSGLLSPEAEIVDESSLQNCSDKNTNSLTGSDKSTSDITDDSLRDNAISKQKKMEAELKQVFKQHFDEDILGEEMLKYHKSMVTFLKSKHANNKMEETVSTGTNTDIKFLLEECKNFGNASALDQDNVIEGLKKEIYDLSKQNSSLQNVLECTTEQQQKLTAEVARLKKCLTDSAFKIESMKKEFEKKEKESLKDKETLVQSLTHANKFIGSLQQQNASLSEEKLKLCKTVDEMSLSLKKEEDKRKSSLDAQEKKFNAVIESLQKENAELKNRTKHAEFQLLFMKKTEYLKRIEAKSIEVEEVKKEMNTPSMKLWANAAGPEQMKILSTKLNNYVEELKAIRQDFVEKIDEQIKKVKNGASLKDLKEVVMKDLPPVPTYKNTLPEHLLAGMSRLNSMALPYFGTSAHMPSAAVVPPVPTASLLSSATSSLKITPPSAVSTKMISPISPLAATNVISPLAPIAAANIIPSVPPATAVVPPCAPSMATASLTSLSSSVPSVLNKNKESKIDLVNDIDPTIQESFKNAMASINSFASSPYPVPSLDDEFDKKCVVFKHPDPVSSDIKPDHPKVPPGLVNSVPHSASARASAITPIPEPKLEAYNASGNKSYASLDAVPKIKVAANQSTWETEKKKTTTASYSKLLNKLKEQFPTYTQEELISYVKEVRAQRQGKLSGLTIDAIISEISAIMKAKKKMPEPKVQPKPAKVLVNKKLASDPKLAPQEPQVTTKKKTAWNIDTEAALRKFSGSADDDCTICYDSMENSAYKVACGHFFHEDCIRQWLKKNSNCPICRVLLLLPEEYPSLS